MRVAVGEVRVAEDLRADGEQVGVAGQPVERVLEDEDRAGDELLRVGPGEHEQLLVAAEVRHHLAVLAHVRAVAGARERVGEELGRRQDEHARRLGALRGRVDALLVALGEGRLERALDVGRDGELLLLQALELRRPLLERLAGRPCRP